MFCVFLCFVFFFLVYACKASPLSRAGLAMLLFVISNKEYIYKPNNSLSFQIKTEKFHPSIDLCLAQSVVPGKNRNFVTKRKGRHLIDCLQKVALIPVAFDGYYTRGRISMKP